MSTSFKAADSSIHGHTSEKRALYADLWNLSNTLSYCSAQKPANNFEIERVVQTFGLCRMNGLRLWRICTVLYSLSMPLHKAGRHWYEFPFVGNSFHLVLQQQHIQRGIWNSFSGIERIFNFILFKIPEIRKCDSESRETFLPEKCFFHLEKKLNSYCSTRLNDFLPTITWAVPKLCDFVQIQCLVNCVPWILHFWYILHIFK